MSIENRQQKPLRFGHILARTAEGALFVPSIFTLVSAAVAPLVLAESMPMSSVFEQIPGGIGPAAVLGAIGGAVLGGIEVYRQKRELPF